MTFTTNIVPLDREKHGDLKLNVVNSTEHIRDQQLIPIMAAEAVNAAIYFPLMFAKDAGTGALKFVGLVGIEPGENLIYEEGRANADFVPIDVKRYPFYVSKDIENNLITLCINETASALSSEQGDPIFTANDEESPVINNAKEIFTILQHQYNHTEAFIEFLTRNNLLIESNLNLVVDGEEVQVAGLLRINEKAFYDLDDEQINLAHKNQFTPAIHAHLISLATVQRLIDLKRDKAAT